MIVRAIPETFDPACVKAIDDRLDQIVANGDVTIGLAIESGSRAWGFPSHDSDYDCRFIYVRSAEQYLSPWQKRDVIETPLEGDLDISGWDLGKALKLVLKGNAVVTEWLTSPIVYRGDVQFRDDLIAFARTFSRRAGIQRHYLHLGEQQRRTHFADGEKVPLKKLFYALRPAAALRWLRLNPTEVVAPMHFPTLIKECDPPREVSEISYNLVRQKAATRELGTTQVPAAIRAFVDEEFAIARTDVAPAPTQPSAEAISTADEVFRRYASKVAEGWKVNG